MAREIVESSDFDLDYFKELRKKGKFTYKSLADASGISFRAVQDYFRYGYGKKPTIEKIAVALGADLSRIYYNADAKRLHGAIEQTADILLHPRTKLGVKEYMQFEALYREKGLIELADKFSERAREKTAGKIKVRAHITRR